MSKIHIAAPSGSKAEYDEDQIRSMWTQGLLHLDTLYWKEGMKEWAYLSSLFPTIPPPITIPRAIGPNTVEKTTITKSRLDESQNSAAILVPLIWSSLPVVVIYACLDLKHLWMRARAASAGESEIAEWSPGIVGYLAPGFFVLTSIAFLRWVYVANRTCRDLGAQEITYTPAMSVGCYFVPFLNWVWPFRSMKEISKASKNPIQWQTQTPDDTIYVWWGCWLIWNFLGILAMKMDRPGATSGQLDSAAMLTIGWGFIYAFLCIFTVDLVKTIAHRHQRSAASVVEL